MSQKVAEIIEREARARGYSKAAYTTMLFEAAYAARFGKSEDAELTAKVELVLVLWGTSKDVTTIALAVGLSEVTVEKILKAWRDEITVQRSPDTIRQDAEKNLSKQASKDGRG